MIIITAATGKLGRHVVDALLARIPASELAVAVRDPARAADLAARGITVRQADYTQPASLRAAFAGATKLLLRCNGPVLRQPHGAADGSRGQLGLARERDERR